VDAGELIALLANTKRLRIFADDPYVEPLEAQVVNFFYEESAWQDGFSVTSLVKIKDTCPAGRQITLLVNYETKSSSPIVRTVTWGKIILTVADGVSGLKSGYLDKQNIQPVYPMPMESTVTFSLDNQYPHHIEIINLQGENITVSDIPKGIDRFLWDGKALNGTEASPGYYVYKISAGDDIVYTGKLIKR